MAEFVCRERAPGLQVSVAKGIPVDNLPQMSEEKTATRDFSILDSFFGEEFQLVPLRLCQTVLIPFIVPIESLLKNLSVFNSGCIVSVSYAVLWR